MGGGIANSSCDVVCECLRVGALVTDDRLSF